MQDVTQTCESTKAIRSVACIMREKTLISLLSGILTFRFVPASQIEKGSLPPWWLVQRYFPSANFFQLGFKV